MILSEKLKSLDRQLDIYERLFETSLFQYTAPSTNKNTQGAISPLGNITPDLDFDTYSVEKLHLLHTMLHLFYSSKTGKGLTDENIRILHSKVKEKLSEHKIFDKLDRTEYKKRI